MIQVNNWNKIPEKFTGCVRITNNSTYQFVNGIVHSSTGPARVDDDGDTYWFQHGLYHRLDGPARVWLKKCIKHFCIKGSYYEEEHYWVHPLVIEHKVKLILEALND